MDTRMTNRLNWFDWLCLTLVVIGAINWGLVGFFAFDLVGVIFGGTFLIGSRIIFAIVGLAGLYSIYSLYKVNTHYKMMMMEEESTMRRVA